MRPTSPRRPPRPDWSRSLTIPKVMEIKTLRDVRELTRHLPMDIASVGPKPNRSQLRGTIKNRC